MKKIAFLLLLFANMTSFAQNHFSAGAHIGIPIMDIAGISSVNLGLNISYLHDTNNQFKVGAETGYTHFFVDKVGTERGFIPIAVKAQYIFPKSKFFADLGVGFALSLNNTYNGGFYAYPKIGYKLGTGELYLGLPTITSRYSYGIYDEQSGNVVGKSGKSSAGSINFGYNYTFK